MHKDSSEKRINVLHVAKWYPNQSDVQNGIFIKKHVEATALFADVKVLAWLPGNEKTEVIESIESKLAITRVFFKKGLAFSYKRHLFREYIRSHYNNKQLPDLIHLHIFSPDLLLVALWAKKKKIPVVISEHWSGYARGLYASMPYWRKWAYRRLAKLGRILPVSTVARDSMQLCGLDGRFTIVPNVVEANLSQSQKLPGFNFLVVADLIDEVKNISGVMHAFTKLDGQAQLHIIGGGPDEEKLRQLAYELSDKIFMHGRKSNAEVQEWLPKFQAVIVNSRIETFGLLLLEAHAAGLPAIVTRCGGPEDFVEKADILIDVNSQSQLIAAMQQMMSRGEETYIFTRWQACLPKEIAQQLNDIYREEIKRVEAQKPKIQHKKKN